MIQFEAKKEGDNIIVPKKVFNYMVTCYKMQKTIQHFKGQDYVDMQEKMDTFFNEIIDFLNG